MRQHKLDDAADYFTAALRLRPNDLNALQNLGFVLAQKGNNEDAAR